MATLLFPSMSHLFVDTFFEFGIIENYVYRARITVILILQIYSAVWFVSRQLNSLAQDRTKWQLITRQATDTNERWSHGSSKKKKNDYVL